MGLKDVFQSEQNEWLSSDSSTVPVAYSNGKYVAVRSFADCISYKRKAIMAEVAVKIKF